MRRSAAITLTLLAGAGLGLAYCSGDGDADGVLESEAACIGRLGSDAEGECREVFASARATHAATAPRFDTADACREATGADCTPLRAGASASGLPAFIPVMAGVMIGQALADGTRGAAPVYAGLPPACPPGSPAPPGCTPAPSGSGSGSGSSSGSGGAGGGSRRFWYSGSSYAGTSENEGRGGFRRASVSSDGAGMLSRGARSGIGSGSGSSRAGVSSSRSGGLGFSAAAHGGGS